ncbi:DUF192 domain-containing protein [Streptomyces sp. V1I1]|uniref:DUF192 domain-containing protein n=1 Tax=Streptomyces sp. V1I1 TaxID=3042272 RepID=UPI00278B228F|nr:DUF192 domain-containing protein [Streptomyces sp. V1I1]MDQ0941063.1 uncharacterized membrane protein (UPF0127 family) [Streptomyces sp. V1I1]
MRKWRNGVGTMTVPGQVDAADTDTDTAVKVEIAASYKARRRGLLGRDGIDGAIMLTPCNSVHTFRMRFTIDVAYLDKELKVVDVRTMEPGRLGMVRFRGRHVLEAEAGAMAEWGLRPGVRVAIEAASHAD